VVRGLRRPDQAPDIIAQSRTAESLYVDWQRRVRTGLRQLQESYVDLYRATSLFRVYSPTLVPGLLQTEGYARALLGANARLLDIPDDSAEAALARLQRSQIIHEPRRRFVLLIEEGVLRYQLGDHDAMAAQLGYLLTAGALPAVSLGIIPSATRERAMWPQEVFHIYDETLVSVELLSARVKVTQPSARSRCTSTAFEQLRSMAVYGAEARRPGRPGDRGPALTAPSRDRSRPDAAPVDPGRGRQVRPAAPCGHGRS
jgi:hypothetical protein